MKIKNRLIVSLFLLACANAFAQTEPELFDKTLMAGVWAESVDTSPACDTNNLHNSFEFSDDGKTLVFKLDRPWKIATDKEVSQYSAKIIQESHHSLTIEYFDTADLPEDYPKEWDIIFVADGVYRWKASSWPDAKVNSVVGIRCSK